MKRLALLAGLLFPGAAMAQSGLQITQFPPAGSLHSGDALLLQQGATGTPYTYTNLGSLATFFGTGQWQAGAVTTLGAGLSIVGTQLQVSGGGASLPLTGGTMLGGINLSTYPLTLGQSAAPSAPGSGGAFYIDSSNVLHFINPTYDFPLAGATYNGDTQANWWIGQYGFGQTNGSYADPVGTLRVQRAVTSSGGSGFKTALNVSNSVQGAGNTTGEHQPIITGTSGSVSAGTPLVIADNAVIVRAGIPIAGPGIAASTTIATVLHNTPSAGQATITLSAPTGAATPAGLSVNVGYSDATEGEDGVVATCYTWQRTTSTQPNCVGAMIQAFKFVPGNVAPFGADVTAYDNTGLSSSHSGPITSMELDAAASGPDDGSYYGTSPNIQNITGNRKGIDMIPMSAGPSADGVTNIAEAIQVRLQSLAFANYDPVTVNHAFFVRSTSSWGTIFDAYASDGGNGSGINGLHTFTGTLTTTPTSTTAGGSNVLTMGALTVNAGQRVSDANSCIPAGTTISSVNENTGQAHTVVTLSANATCTVGLGDNITFANVFGDGWLGTGYYNDAFLNLTNTGAAGVVKLGSTLASGTVAKISGYANGSDAADLLFNANGTISTSGAFSATGMTLSAITGSTQCLQVNTAGLVSGSGATCGGGGGGGTITGVTAGTGLTGGGSSGTVTLNLALTSGLVTSALGFTPVSAANNLSDLANAATARTNLGLGSIATQNASAVALTGGSISGTFTGNPTFSGNLAVGGTTTVAGITSTQPVLAGDGSGHNGSFVLNFPNVAALTAWQPTNIGTNMVLARTAGYTTAGDGGDAEYAWVASDNVSGNTNKNTITPTGWVASGRWHMVLPPGGVHPEAFGLKCDGTTDDSLAWHNMTSFMVSYYGTGGLSNGGGPTLSFIPGHTCYLGPAHIGVGLASRLTARGSYNAINSPNSTLVQTPQITLDPSQTFNVYGKLEDVYIRRYGLPAPTTMEQNQAAINQWAGESSVGVTVTGIDAVIEDSIIVGFNKCLYMSSQAPLIVRNLNVDCVNGVEITNDRGGSQIDGLRSGNYYAYNLISQHAISAVTVTAPGTGYTNAAVMTMTGGTCTTAPQITITTSGGAITGATVSDTGDCTGTTAANPTFTGGGGTGATFSAFWVGPGYRPGKGLYVHDYCDACTFSNIVMGGFHIGIDVSDVFTNTFSNINLEPGTSNSDFTSGDTGAIGILIENCISAKFSNLYLASGLGTALYVNDKSQSDGGTGCANNVQPMVTFSNVELASPATEHNQQMLYLAPYSRGEISNILVGGPAYVAGSSVVIAANTRDWFISGLVGSGGTGATTPLYSIDPTSAPVVRIESTPTITALNAGATLTVNCNTIVYVNDSTAPTITLPATCPLGQDVSINTGPLASAHTITLSMPGGSTLDGASSQPLTSNYVTSRVRYNGLAAYLN